MITLKIHVLLYAMQNSKFVISYFKLAKPTEKEGGCNTHPRLTVGLVTPTVLTNH